jgi:glucose/arabinose dehydrogenase
VRRWTLVCLAAAAVLAGSRVRGASAGGAAKAEAATPAVVLTPITNGLSGITAITNAGDARLFLTLQEGQIVIWDGAAVRATPFLDITSLVLCCGERGLLSTAFHPDYAVNGLFFVYYTDRQGNLVIARYRRTADPNIADPSSGVILLHIDHPTNSNHNGGQLQFGPDGFLYIGTGDGGSAFDPPCNAQRNDVLLGKLLRIDVNQSVDTPPYHGIPADNPFVSTTGPPEAWAKGLRNPWRFSFDRLTHDLVIGDVGQGSREEVDFQPAGSAGGLNYGWKIMEGTLCTGNTSNCPADVPPCDDPRLTPPVLEYDHGGGRCSITGGYVYRGLAIPDLYGMYVYGDYCAGTIWAAAPHGTTWTPVTLPIQTGTLTTFGEDINGEIYAGTGNGELFLIQTTAVPVPVVGTIQPTAGFERGGETVQITGANFTSQTRVSFGNTQAVVHVLSPTLLEAVTPVHPAGAVDVTVENPGATPAVKASAYTYVVLERADAARPGTRVVVRP